MHALKRLYERNLTDFQRNEVALKYEEIISERMRERQKQSGYAYGNGGKGVDQMNHIFEDKTSKRKELAQIANTSEGSIQRTQFSVGCYV